MAEHREPRVFLRDNFFTGRDEVYRERFRVRPEVVDALVTRLGHLIGHTTSRSRALSVEEQVEVGIITNPEYYTRPLIIKLSNTIASLT